MGDNYLVKPLPEVPADMRETLGIHQSDVILRTAIIAGIADLRANPDLLDYVFASLPKDGLTFKEYGENQVQQAKDWFLNTDIPVFMNTRVDESKVPCITIAVTGSSEAEADLGDVHFQTAEPIGTKPKVWYRGVAIDHYDASTGIIVTAEAWDVYPGMLVQTKAGKTYPISEVLDAYTFIVATSINDDLSTINITSTVPESYSIESVGFRETFEIGAHALGEPVQLSYLWSILVFVLYRYKEELMEARGLERTTVSAGPTYLNTSFATTQPVFTRMTTVTGFVRQYWPKFKRTPVDGVATSLTFVEANSPEQAVPIHMDEIE